MVGKGSPVAEAVDNWDMKPQAHLRNAGEDDPVVIFIKGFLVKAAYVETTQPTNIVRKSREQNIAEFETQFYGSRRNR